MNGAMQMELSTAQPTSEDFFSVYFLYANIMLLNW